ncbi:hypothetical protein [Streptosporangium oxazolinicum]
MDTYEHQRTWKVRENVYLTVGWNVPRPLRRLVALFEQRKR